MFDAVELTLQFYDTPAFLAHSTANFADQCLYFTLLLTLTLIGPRGSPDWRLDPVSNLACARSTPFFFS